ncbi:MAG: pyruvate ferredoxin oxidoreductase, partial [Gammaproteobacteria bacterium]
TTYVLQGTIHNVTHLLEGFIEGLNARRPALFNIYSVCQPEHGVADDASRLQSKLAVESRAYPLLRFDPDAGSTWADCCDLDGNPARDQDWPSYTINYLDEDGKEATMDLPMTFADFAMTEGRFRKHFRTAPRDTWNENMILLSEYLELDGDDREERFPYLWAVGKDDKLLRVIPSDELVTSTEERRDHWRLLRSIAGSEGAGASAQAADQVRSEMAQKLSAVIMEMAGGGDINVGGLATGSSVGGGNGSGAAPEGYEPVWIDTPECTACDECVDINPKIFAYNDKKLAIVVDPRGGPYRDIVRSAEKCTAAAIHPGTPPDPGEKDIEKFVKRAAKYQ